MASGRISLKLQASGWSPGTSEFNLPSIRLARTQLSESVNGYIKRPTPGAFYAERDWLLDEDSKPDWEGSIAWVCTVLEINLIMLQKFIEMGFSQPILDMVGTFDGSDKAATLLVVAIKKEIKNGREAINSYKRGTGIQEGVGRPPPAKAR